MKTFITAFLLAGAVALAAGCAQPRTVYIPIYPAPATYGAQPVLMYPGQVASVPASGTMQASPNAAVPQVVVLETRNVAPLPPPPSQIETISGVPSGDYVWQPGHWGWNGAWVWISGQWTLKPFVTAHWEPGHWEKHGNKYFWIEGHWW